MQADPRTFLWDVREVVDAIDTFTAERGLTDYPADLMRAPPLNGSLRWMAESNNNEVKYNETVLLLFSASRKWEHCEARELGQNYQYIYAKKPSQHVASRS
jgi:hypothetical protein